MSEKTEQVEGGGSKVPEEWPTLKLTRRSPDDRPQDLSAFPFCKCGCQTEGPETYIPVSALLSDEVVEAAARCRFEQGQFKESEEWADLLPHLQESMKDEAREVLQAAIEQVGGGQGE